MSSALRTYVVALSNSAASDGDAWSDDGVVRVGELAARLGDDDLSALRASWSTFSPMWQKHCAETLDAARPERAVPLLIEMARVGSPVVGFAALESLRNIDASRLGGEQIAGIRSAIDARLGAPATPLEQRLLEDFAARLANPARGDASLGTTTPAGSPATSPEACSTAAAIAAVHANPQRLLLPLEGALSLPVPFMADAPKLAFFWASQGGPVANRRYSAPYCRTLVDPRCPEDAIFETLAPGSLGIPAGASLASRVGRSLSLSDRRSALAEFSVMTDAASALFDGLAADPSDGVSSSLRAYESRFLDLAVTALLPAYRALSPAFFAWLAVATRSGK